MKSQVCVDNEDLPERYDTTEVVLLVQDPHSLYVYWEIDFDAMEKARVKIGDQWPTITNTLRFYDVSCLNFDGTNAHYWFDVDVPPFDSNKYIHLDNQDASYCCDLGLRTGEGQFFSLARSNFVTMPRSGLSGNCDLNWKHVGENEEGLPFVKKGHAVRHAKNHFDPNRCSSISPQKRTLSKQEILNYYLGPEEMRKGLGKIVFDDPVQQSLFEQGYFKYFMAGSSAEGISSFGLQESFKKD